MAKKDLHNAKALIEDHIDALDQIKTPIGEWKNKNDFRLKAVLAVFTAFSYIYIVFRGAHSETMTGGESSTFQLLSIVGPLFGMMIQYYFGERGEKK